MPVENINLFDKKDDFKPTVAEMQVIADKMKDPEFAKLMHEYMESLNDPETKKEEEAYLAQMEREAKEGGDFSFDFIFPKPSFCVELLEKGGKKNSKRVIVNLCTSDKVDEYREETTNNRQGSNWHVPVSVSKERDEDYQGEKCMVFDAVFNPKTMALADRSDKFVCFLVEVVVENINQGYQQTFGFKFLRQPSSVKAVGVPQNQTVRKQNGKSAFPLSDEAVSKRPIKPTAAALAAAAASSSAKPTAAKPAAAAPPAPVAAAAAASSSLPKHSILHRGEIDLTDAWNWKVVDRRIGIPKELVAKLELPEVATAGDLDIDVTEHYIDVIKSSKHSYHGTIPLPFSVDATPVSAKFDKTKRVLTLTLRVVPPEKPAEAVAPPELFPQIRNSNNADDEQPDDVKKEGAAATAVEMASAAGPPPLPPAEVPSAASPKKVEDSAAPAPQPPAAAVPAPIENQAVTSPTKVGENIVAPNSPPAPAAPKPEPHQLSNDGDRMTQMMAKIAEARKEREEAEEAERIQHEQQQKAEEEKKKKKDSANVAVVNGDESSVEVVDLRKKQQEWLDGVKEQQKARDDEEQRLEEEAQRQADEEARKKLKENRKRMEEEKEAERAESKMKEAMERLPLRSKYIFDLC